MPFVPLAMAFSAAAILIRDDNKAAAKSEKETLEGIIAMYLDASWTYYDLSFRRVRASWNVNDTVL